MSEQGEIQQRITEAEYAATSATGDAIIAITNYYYREEARVAPVESADAEETELPCPYRGLFHFGPNDAEFFFGRDIFIEELYNATKTRNFIPVLGASGSGKSSVVFAGLVPKLQKEGHWQFTHFRPGSDPFHALSLALVPLYATNLNETERIIQARQLASSLQNREIPLADVFEQIQHNYPQDRILLIADQFEELYTLCSDIGIRRDFLDKLISDFPAVLVMTMRADFLGNALSYRPFADVLQNADLKLGPMNREELTKVIVQPAAKLGVTFEAGLVERILEDVEDQPGNLPLLEFALTELWNKRTSKELTHKIYEDIGEVKGALARHADEKYGNLSNEEKEKVRRIFIQLVRPGKGTEDTRRIALKAELGEESWSLVNKLADARLVVTSRNATQQETVEVVHEALIRNWKELKGWMDTHRVFRAWQERLRVLKEQWKTTDKDAGSLLRGAALVEAEEQLKERPEDLSDEKEFIRLSIQEREKRKHKERRSRQVRNRFFVALLLIASIAAGVFYKQWREAKKLSGEVFQRQLVAEIGNLSNEGLSLWQTKVLLFVELKRRFPSSDIPDSLKNELPLLSDSKITPQENQNSEISFCFPFGQKASDTTPDGKYKTTKMDTERHFELIEVKIDRKIELNNKYFFENINGGFSKNGNYLIGSGHTGRTPRVFVLWKVNNEIKSNWNLVDLGNEDAWKYLTFSQNEKFIATKGFGAKEIKIWEESTHQELIRIPLDGYYFIFSPNEKHFSVLSSDGIHIFEIYKNKSTIEIAEQAIIKRANFINSESVFSQNSQYLFTFNNNIAQNNIAQIWEVHSGEEVTRFFYEKEMQSIQCKTNNSLGTLSKKLYSGNAIVFSSDGKYLAKVDGETVELWNVDRGSKIKNFDFPRNYVATSPLIDNLIFSPDKKYLGLVADSNYYHVWEISSNKKLDISDTKEVDNIFPNESFKENDKYSLKNTEDDMALVQETGGSRKVVRLNLDQRTNLTSVTGIDGKIYSVDILEGKTVIVKEDSSNQEIVRLSHEDTVKDVALSPDGRYLATVSMDGTTQLVRLLSPEQLISEICSRLTRNLSWEEWQQYLKNEPYRKTCPNLPVHPSLTEEGRKLAKEGNIKAAIASFQRVQKIDPNIDLNPETEAIDKDPKAVAELIAPEASPD